MLARSLKRTRRVYGLWHFGLAA
jgi:hypothetical protein